MPCSAVKKGVVKFSGLFSLQQNDRKHQQQLGVMVIERCGSNRSFSRFFLNFSKNGAICNQENYTNSGNYWKQGFEGLRDGAIVAHVRCSADLHLTDVQHARDVKALS